VNRPFELQNLGKMRIPSWKRQGECSVPYARFRAIILKKIIFTISF